MSDHNKIPPHTDTIAVSFCIACMNRLHHLCQTLPMNIKDNLRQENIEFVLVDYSSTDGLKNWIERTMEHLLEKKLLTYLFVKGQKYFHHSRAKNIAHRLARGRIVCNLDADNFTGSEFAEYLGNIFGNRGHLIMTAPRNPNGTFGRIAMLREDFMAIGGYDERMKYGWGYEDTDLIIRALKLGFREHTIPKTSRFLESIQHKQSERAKYNRLQNIQVSQQIHKRLSEHSIRRGIYIANRGARWGICD
jgi:predicted glycosyltransferase involved in capsule biosynthesis